MDAGSLRGIADAAVSPVIGTVLILAIAVLGIAVVVTWGLPAISELKSGTELRAVIDQFRDLDASVRALVTGSAGQTSIRWQPSVDAGSVSVSSRGDRWIVAATLVPGHGFLYGNATGDTATIAVRNVGASVPDATMKAWRIVGGQATELRVYRSTDCSLTLGSTPLSPAWGNDTVNAATAVQTVTFCTNTSVPARVSLHEGLVRLVVYNATKVPVESAWFNDLGEVVYQSSLGAATKYIFATNGALFSGPLHGLAPQSDLPVSPPHTFVNAAGEETVSLFLRMIEIDGTASFSGGAGRPGVFLNLYGTFRLAEEGNVQAVRIYDFGLLRDVWYAHLAETAAGYRFVVREGTVGAEDVRWIEQTEGSTRFRFTFVHSVVTVVP
ncbi:MAG TPA: hypothetical protein VM681_05875 [Candidatus Thermoplasmatota archaeon]|nr:hypothetical protein [Candidatus Thermoplasmatota archaeon]